MIDKNQLKTTEDQTLIEQVANNIAFEQMIVAVLTGAFAGGAMIFSLNMIQLILNDFSVVAVVSILLETVFVAIVIFLTGFFASVALGAPLYSALEKRKRRNLWPYLVASLAVALIVFSFTIGGLPAAADMRLETLLAIFAPAIIIAVTFSRLMKPHWIAARKAEEAAAEPVFFRLH